jgi:citrate lyase subunit beta/citryl-CoA lyase
VSSEEFAAVPPLRSLLFVPGTRTEWLPKAKASGADAVILDLEDAVPGPSKNDARDRVAEAVANATTPTFVRINPLVHWTAADELRAVVRRGRRWTASTTFGSPTNCSVGVNAKPVYRQMRSP